MDKIEVVMIVGCDENGSIMRAYEIERDWESGLIKALKPLDGEATVAGGLFADLLEAD